MNWDRFEQVVSQAKPVHKAYAPSISRETTEILVTEYNLLNPKEKLYYQIDKLQPEGWNHITEDCEDFGFITNRMGRFVAYTTIRDNDFAKFIKSKRLLLVFI